MRSALARRAPRLHRRVTKDPDAGLCVVLVMSAFSVAFLTDGFVCSIMLLIPIWLKRGIGSAFIFDCILAIICGGIYLMSPLVNLLVARIGVRSVAVLGSVISSVSILCAAFAINVITILVSLGIFATIGFGFTYIAAIMCISVNLEARRPIAMGIVACGTGFGNAIYSVTVARLNQTFPWQNVVVLLLCLNIQAIVISMLLRNRENQKPADIVNMVMSQLSMSPNVRGTLPQLIASVTSVGVGNARLTHVLDPKDVHINQALGPLGSTIYMNKVDECLPTLGAVAVEDTQPLLRSPAFLLMVAGCFLSTFALLLPNLCTYNLMLRVGIDESEAATVLAVYGGLNALCRAGVGFLASMERVNVLVLYAAANAAGALLLAGTMFMTQLSHFFVYAIVFAGCQACLLVLPPLMVAELVPIVRLTNAMSVQLVAYGFGCLSGLPTMHLVQYLVPSDRSEFVLAICALLASAGLVLCCYFVWKKEVNKEEELREFLDFAGRPSNFHQ